MTIKKNFQERLEQLSQKHTLELQLDNGLFDYLSRTCPPEITKEQHNPVEYFVSLALKEELRDGSFQFLNARSESLRTRVVWMQENFNFFLKFLLQNSTSLDEKTVGHLVDVYMPLPEEKRHSRIMVDDLTKPPRRSAKLSLAATSDTQKHQVTITLDGWTLETLKSEAGKVNLSPEEFSLHVLNNYRDNEDIRRVEASLAQTADMYWDINTRFISLVEMVLMETNPEIADEIKTQFDEFWPERKNKESK